MQLSPQKQDGDGKKHTALHKPEKLIEAAGEDAIVLSDLRPADGNGIELLQWMRKQGKNQPFIMMTDYAEVHTAVETMKSGAEDYVPKKLLEEKILPSIRKLQKRSEQICRKKENIYERKSEAFYQIRQRIRLVAPTDMTVLIFGENGTGKEYIAEKIHLQSKRTDKPFVPVDCGSLSVNLAQSAFFRTRKRCLYGRGHEKGGGIFRKQKAAHFFSMKWETCLMKHNRCYCEPYKRGDTVR